MGLQIFEQSGYFDPAARGLKAGDTVDVICVGGGSSGAAYKTVGTQDHWPSVAGEASTFGDISSADGIVMGRGGAGKDGAELRSQSGCGAGGYMPGLSMYGGSGGTPEIAGTGLAGTLVETPSPWCNFAGDGNKGAGGSLAPGGNGYGAGGGGDGGYGYAAPGGDAGKIAFGSMILTSTAPIAVTIGAGGVNEQVSTVSGAPGVVLVFW